MVKKRHTASKKDCLRADCISIFPEMFAALTEYGITRRAHEEGLWRLRLWNPRDFVTETNRRNRRVDDRPYGGGPGMVMQAEPLAAAIAAAREAQENDGVRASRVVALSPQGVPLNHPRVTRFAEAALAGKEGLILLCGRYEGIDERLLGQAVDEEVTIGDFVVSGGELPAMLLLDAVIRQLPGTLGDEQSASSDSFAVGLLDCPHYTRPPIFCGEQVPEVLLKGDHDAIRRWRLKAALARTRYRRPDLLAAWQAESAKAASASGQKQGATESGGMFAVEAVVITQLLDEVEAEEQCGER